MKKNLKRIFTLFLCSIICFSNVMMVAAESALNTFTASNYTLSNTPVSFPATFRVKKTSDGKYVYCAHYAKTPPATSVTYTKGSLITDNGMNYILNQSYSAQNDNDFFVYQTALWVYMADKGIMPGSHYTLTKFSSQVKNNSSATASKINDLVAKAKTVGANDTSAPTIKVDASNSSFALNSAGTYYVSDVIAVTSSTGSFKVTLTNAPDGSKVENSGKGFIIKVPADQITDLTTKVSFTVSNSKVVYTSYYYNPSVSSYQVMTATYKETLGANDKASLEIQKEVGGVSISKQDITNGKELPGATLVIKDYDGNEIETWVSTDEPHIIENLEPGIYTLTETIAPEGYILSTETITFTVKGDGSVTKVVMYNSPDTKEVVEEEVPVENTASFKTITSSVVGVMIVIAGMSIILKNSKRKEF